MMKNLFRAVAMALIACTVHAQSPNFWTKATEPSDGKKIPSARAKTSTYQLFDLDLSAFRSAVANVPSRESGSTRKSDVILSFPNPQGKLERFRVIEAAVMHPDLAAKYPGIKSFAGQGIDDPTATLRFSLSDQLGFHGMILSGEKHTYYIDPYSIDKKTYSVYARSTVESVSDFQCFTQNADMPSTNDRTNSAGRTNDKKLRKYRLALSCNAEYGNIFAGTGTDAQKKANILAQMNVAMTRVNGIYERDLSITMQLIPNNDLLLYFGSTSADPWSGD